MSISLDIAHDFGGFHLAAKFATDEPGITALFGPSGSGKTSIINAIAGLLRPDRGNIVIGGETVLDTHAGMFVPPRLRRVGYVFQDARLFPHMSVENNLRFGQRRAPVKAEEDEFDRVVSLLGLEALLARRPLRLSGGEKSRVALGRALLSSPRILLLDEPLAALDAARKAEIMPYLEKLRDDAKVPMLYVSHSLEEVAQLADSVIAVRDGNMVAQGPVFDMLADLEVSAITGAPSFGAVIDTRVRSHSGDGLTVLGFDGGQLAVPRLNRDIGQKLRVRIRAEDVMLATEEPRTISANNVLLCRVSALRETDSTHADVQLQAGRARFVARITRASAVRLGLKAGMPVFAVMKSVIVDPQARKVDS
ncbi:MAG TPA: molybdenum ABC transporter ATP-binding protein [Rhizomicrobium sp.]|nr:molybdenum ABC transporter ATP-binding protein [Rhizomicrobium sp.]